MTVSYITGYLQGEYCSISFKGKSIGILRPVTYMNHSGMAARKVRRLIEERPVFVLPGVRSTRASENLVVQAKETDRSFEYHHHLHEGYAHGSRIAIIKASVVNLMPNRFSYTKFYTKSGISFGRW